ncbi:MAG: class I fructose-bisphosphate aldolase [Nanoarchaeota archaeon]
MAERPTFDDLSLCAGRRARLHHMIFDRGIGNGTFMILPIDQGLEHGEVDFFPNPDAEHPLYQFELATQGNFSAIACHIGLAEKYYPKYAGRLPLVLKLNGKTNIVPSENAISTCTGTVQDAIRLGASAVGYTLFVGSPRQDEDIAQFREVRRQAHAAGIPVIVWAYPRGKHIENKGGTKSLYAVTYAARVAQELGADIIKVNFPEGVNQYCPEPYRNMEVDFRKEMQMIMRAAGHSLVIFAGGSKSDDSELLEKLQIAMEEGGAGVIFGRNMWQRPFDEGLKFAGEVRETLQRF